MFGKIFKIAVNIILLVLVAIGVLVVFSFVPLPRLFGGQAGNYKVYTVQSGSMEPAIKAGSLIFVKPGTDYEVGEIITRRAEEPGVTITHRIVSKEDIEGQIAFETKGDSNETSDGKKFTKEGILGKVFLSVPYLGYPVSYARTAQGIILIVIIPAVIIIYDELNKIKAEIGKIKEKRKKTENNEKIDQ